MRENQSSTLGKMFPSTPPLSAEKAHADRQTTSTAITTSSTTSVADTRPSTPSILPARPRQSRDRSMSPTWMDLPYRVRDLVPKSERRTVVCPVLGCRSTVVHQHPPARQHYSPRTPIDQREEAISPRISSVMIPETEEWQAAQRRRGNAGNQDALRTIDREIDIVPTQMASVALQQKVPNDCDLTLEEAEELTRKLREDIARGQCDEAPSLGYINMPQQDPFDGQWYSRCTFRDNNYEIGSEGEPARGRRGAVVEFGGCLPVPNTNDNGNAALTGPTGTQSSRELQYPTDNNGADWDGADKNGESGQRSPLMRSPRSVSPVMMSPRPSSPIMMSPTTSPVITSLVTQPPESHSYTGHEALIQPMAKTTLQESPTPIVGSVTASDYTSELCISMQCLVGHPHPVGRYLARGHVPRTWNDHWGLSDPPDEIWQAWVRMENGTAREWDEIAVYAFSACHFWDGPEAGNAAGERLLGRRV